ncbi:MAG TPA: matrixin family metalloprotease [Isosphaeraceae bacterium]|jgi:hypothetical protein
MLKRIWNRAGRARKAARPSRERALSQWDALEEKQLLSGPSDYVLSGDSWANPAKITYSFPPDGVSWDGGVNNLNASMNAWYPNGGWQRAIAEALQTWASVANINVVPVADGGQPFNAPGMSQGDPRFGDVRIGGYNFNSSTVLAQSYNPPPNGVTGAGDVEINTGFNWAPNPNYDLFSVLLHETGLALGLGETTDPTAVMNRTYGGLRTSLEPVDINGIQAIYGPRVPDPLQALGQATSVGSAFDVSGLLKSAGAGIQQSTVYGLSLDAIGDTEYFSVVAPAGAGTGTLVAMANPQGISSLSPKVTIYDDSMHPLAVAGSPQAWSDAQFATAGGIVPGHRYIVAISGATNDVFSVGAYNFQVTFSGISAVSPPPPVVPPTPVPPPPPPITVPPSPTTTPVAPDRFYSTNNSAQTAVNLGTIGAIVIPGLTTVNATDYQAFRFAPFASGTVVIATWTSSIWVVNSAGQTVATGNGVVSFPGAKAGASYWIAVGPANGQPNPGFSLAIAVVPSARPSQQVVAPAVAAGWTTPLPTPAPTPAPVQTPATSSWRHAQLATERPGRPLSRVAVVNPRWVQLG